jgi:hypothetical protein
MEVMRGQERFDRYYRRIQLGLRLMAHGARIQTASTLSGLTADQLTTLRKRWMWNAQDGYRGPAPTSFRPIFRSLTLTSHASLFVGLCRLLGSLSARPSLETGEILCEAYETYRAWEPTAPLKFDQALMLASGAAQDEEIALIRCEGCGCSLLVDQLSAIKQRRCTRCLH